MNKTLEYVTKRVNEFLPTVWSGVNSLLYSYASITPSDFAVLVYTSDATEAAIWVSLGLEKGQIPYCRIWTNPLVDFEFEDALQNAIPCIDEIQGRLVVFTFERDTMSHTETLNRIVEAFPPSRRLVYRVISASKELFETALLSTPQQLEALNITLLKQLMPARRLQITTQGGTELRVSLDSERHRWISNRGIAKEGGTIILPAGEVATYPASVDGIFVADFAFNVNTVTNRDARLSSSPVKLELKNGYLQSFACSDSQVYSFIKKCLSSPCAPRVGELGFGTNLSVRDPISLNSHVNERRCGVHLGFGQHNQDPGVVDYQCEIHLDLIARGGKVWVDDCDVPIDLEQVIPSEGPHPRSTRDEDVFSPEVLILDSGCCGSTNLVSTCLNNE